VDLTLAICTYNGESRLPKVLDCLRSQCQTETFSWEVLVVDNASCDRSAQIVQAYQADWPHHLIPLGYCFEAKPGLAFARRKAIAMAQGELIGFLDDDTLPTECWVKAAYDFGQQHPEAGAYGSQIHGQYEIAPPPDFHKIASCLAIIERGNQPFQYSSKRGVLPAGAGLVVRKSAWLAHVPDKPQLIGTCQHSLVAKGEDMETLIYLRNAGCAIWYNPAMALYHQIPKERLAPSYLEALCRSIGLNRYLLRQLQHSRGGFVALAWLYGLSDLRKIILHYLKYGLHPQTSPGILCERILLLYSLLSPVVYWQQRLRFLLAQPLAAIASPDS
jgi:glycosyltransferase involved in cell wall biosynthesis